MWNSWFHLTDLDGGPPFFFPAHLFATEGPSGGNLFSPIVYLLDKSLYRSSNLYIPGSLVLEGAFNCTSNFTAALLFWFASHSSFSTRRELPGKSCHSRPGNVKHITRCERKLPGLCFGPKSRKESSGPWCFKTIDNFTVGKFLKEFEQCQTFRTLSLAAAFVSPFDNLNPKVLAIPQENTDSQMNGLIDQTPSVSVPQEFPCLPFPEMNWTSQAVEPITGVKFPTVLHNRLSRNINSTEILVGTGSRNIRIIKIKSVRVYAFGIYVHPGLVCEKLGPKYSSVPVGEPHDCPGFFDDLLREDISMTVRLVVNCNGLNIKTVREVFEKSLRARLLKMNPNTDSCCLSTFRSYFAQDIPLAVGTTIDFQRTADGQLITEIDGKQIGAVHSKDLCRSFFDMYIGDNPVSVLAKEEVGRKVGSIMSRCRTY